MTCTNPNPSAEMTPEEWFLEILQPKDVPSLPERIDCYILINIDPKCCGALARDLNYMLPLRRGADQSSENQFSSDSLVKQQQIPITEHLKRIRRRPAMANEIEALVNQTAIADMQTDQTDLGCYPRDEKSTESPSKEAPKKRAKRGSTSSNDSEGAVRTWSLDMLVGSVAAVDNLQSQNAQQGASVADKQNTKTNSLESILTKHNFTVTDLVRIPLPGRPAKTKEELHQWNNDLWPTIFFEKQTDQFKEDELKLSDEERMMMVHGMSAAVKDALMARVQWSLCFTSPKSAEEKSFGYGVAGVVVMDPESGLIVSRASSERQLQAGNVGAQSNFPDRNNPMCTSTILAIQGVSRKERGNAIGHGMESNEFQRGQYLCTG